MKKNFIRLLAIMTLASSLSAFALSAKPGETGNTKTRNTPCETAPGPSVPQTTDRQPDNDIERSRQKLIEEQEKQWLYDTRNNDAG